MKQNFFCNDQAGNFLKVGDKVVVTEINELEGDRPEIGDMLKVTKIIDTESNYVEFGKYAFYGHRVLKLSEKPNALVDDIDLINELKNRGYNTSLLLNLHDVEFAVKQYEEDAGSGMNMDDTDMAYILDSVNYEWYIEQINQEIYQRVCDYVMPV